MCSISKEVYKVNLHNGKVLPPKLTPQDKGKQVIGSSEHTKLPSNVSPIKTLMVNPSQVDYNIEAHLRKLLAKLSIFYSLVLFKEMRKSLIKVLLDP